ncbi:hypothetical protein VP018_002727 [Morganella morganii]|nr:hypothetical protein [Morganella morganii]
MSFGDFLSKALRLVGKTAISVATEIINKGPLQINSQYLRKLSELNLNGYQHNLVSQAQKMNNSAIDMKNEQRDISDRIKKSKNEIKKINDTKIHNMKNILSLITENYPDLQSKILPNGIVKVTLADIGVELVDFNDFLCHFSEAIPKAVNHTEFFQKLKSLTELHLSYQESSAFELLEYEKTLEYDIELLREKKNEYSDFSSELYGILQEVREFGDPLFKEQQEKNK